MAYGFLFVILEGNKKGGFNTTASYPIFSFDLLSLSSLFIIIILLIHKATWYLIGLWLLASAWNTGKLGCALFLPSLCKFSFSPPSVSKYIYRSIICFCVCSFANYNLIIK